MQKAVLFKLKDKGAWASWCNKLTTTLKNEALKTLAEEKVLQEMALTFNINGVDYVLGYMDGEMLPANMERELNQKHKEMKSKCLEYVSDADVSVLYNLEGSRRL